MFSLDIIQQIIIISQLLFQEELSTEWTRVAGVLGARPFGPGPLGQVVK